MQRTITGRDLNALTGAGRLTGSKERYSRDEVISFFLACLDDPDRRDFLLVDPAGRIAGECVINEIDWDARCANFRIGIFRPEDRGQGLGTWAVRVTRDLAFEALGLHRLALNVFSFNPRARRAYLAAGFREEGVCPGCRPRRGWIWRRHPYGHPGGRMAGGQDPGSASRQLKQPHATQRLPL